MDSHWWPQCHSLEVSFLLTVPVILPYGLSNGNKTCRKTTGQLQRHWREMRWFSRKLKSFSKIFTYQYINVSQIHYISLLFKQSVVNTIWPSLDDSLWTSIIVQSYNTVMPSGTFEVLRTLSPMLTGSRQLCICSSSVLHSVISHFSAVFFVSWLPASHMLPSLCRHLLSKGPRVTSHPQGANTEGQFVHPPGCLYTEPDPEDLRPSCLQVSRGSFESDFLVWHSGLSLPEYHRARITAGLGYQETWETLLLRLGFLS